MDWILAVVCFGGITLTVKWIWTRKSVHSTWKRLGVPGPDSPSLLFGNMLQLIKEGRFKLLAEWTKKYGKISGHYIAGEPNLVVSDPDMVHEILVKQFHKFHQRKIVHDDTQFRYIDIHGMDGEKWKRCRTVLYPTFAPTNLQKMSPLIQTSVTKLMEVFDIHAKNGESFDVTSDIQVLCLDAISAVAFGYDSKVFEERENNIFLNKILYLRSLMNPRTASTAFKLMNLCFVIFPPTLTIAKWFNPGITNSQNSWFYKLGYKMITDRQASKEKKEDYLQLILDVSDQLSMDEMQGHTFVFLAAGYATTEATLLFAFHYLANNPGVQSKLQKTIDEHYPDKNGEINYDSVTKLEYLDQVICEASRLGTVGMLAITRQSAETTQLCGITIPKGTKITINTMDLHSDPELWGPEPVEDFVPERFSADRRQKRHPMAHLPFGGGPRGCIAQQFAMLEMKMILVNTLLRYSIMKTHQTKEVLECTTSGIHSPEDGIFIKLQCRSMS